MSNENSFQYTYSALRNQEVLDIRKKYLPREESKMEELQRLDHLVQNSGTAESLITGTSGCLIFGYGMCLCMEVIGNSIWLGILLGLVGAVTMLFAYPVYRKSFQKCKEKYTPRILELSGELTGNN